MNIIEKLLTRNDYSRPGRALTEKRSVILHWTGAPMQKALNTWDYFETGCPREKHYASAHYIVDLNGDVYRAVPDNEVAYHCGSSQSDPKSGKIYTDWARNLFGKYAASPQSNSPNNAALGIEMCTIDNDGNFTPETVRGAAELTAYLIKTYNIPLEQVGTHNMVVGWKDCPRLWTRKPELFEEFKKLIMGLSPAVSAGNPAAASTGKPSGANTALPSESRQKVMKILGEFGCYFLSTVHIAENITGKRIDAVEVFVNALEKGWVQDDVTVLRADTLFSAMTGSSFTVAKADADYKPREGEYEVLVFKKNFTHFVAGDGKGNVAYDPLGVSNTVAGGKLAEKRIFRRA